MPRLAATETLRIGSLDNPATAFSWVQDIAVGADGTIYTAHQHEAAVRVFGADGRATGEIGRSGDGPGELRGVTRMGLLGDTLWVLDTRGNRIVFYDRHSGGLLARRDAAPVKVDDGLIAIETVLWNGVILGRQSIYEPSERPPVPTEIRFWLLPVDGEPRELIRWRPDSWAWVIQMDERSQAQAYQPLLSDELVAASPVDEVVIRIERRAGAPVRITATDFAGDTLWTRALPHEPMDVPAAMPDSLARAMAEQLSDGATDLVDRIAAIAREGLRVPSTLPAVSELRIGHDGTIWLRREITGEPVHEWTVLEPTGDPIAVVGLPAGLRVLEADRTAVWGAVLGDLDVSYIVRYELTPTR